MYKRQLPAMAAVTFLGSSGLERPDLEKIWGLSDSEGRGQLDEAGFFRACKLVALRQNGSEIDVAALATPTPLPRLGSRS